MAPKLPHKNVAVGPIALYAPPSNMNFHVVGDKGPVFLESHLGVNPHGMSSSADHEFLFPAESKLHWSPGLLCHERGAEFPCPQFHFPAETAAYKRLDHSNIVFSHAERRGQKALDDVGHLGGSPQSDAAVQIHLGQGRAGLKISMDHRRKVEGVFPDIV